MVLKKKAKSKPVARKFEDKAGTPAPFAGAPSAVPTEGVETEPSIAEVEELRTSDCLCADCVFYNRDGFRGPHCVNPESPFYLKRMREMDTCDKCTSKA